jgi:hypothetical protein
MSYDAKNTKPLQAATPAKVMPFPGRTPERLVGYGFRHWMKGLDSPDLTSWEEAWNTYVHTVGPEQAKTLLLRLSQFVRAVKANTVRGIEVYPAGARGFCRDECLAISIIAACQHDARPELRACAAALVGSQDIGDTILGAQEFANALRESKQILGACSICQANCPLWQPRDRLM